ncbi:MAG TPA: tetratricopeptide repeat protein [Candidatus Dormibacteraeota bacterium]|nr:tetratricopeptide repeat protein [Candidatus Dormibacteraeota bacterium]
MPAVPASRVTFLLTDVEGSTKKWERDPDLMARLVERHDRLLEEGVRRHGGTVVKNRGEGDSMFATFERADAAVAAALDIQCRITEEPLRVRMAIHSGEVTLREGDYYGIAVNRCARLRSIAHGGQVLLTATVAHQVNLLLPPGASLVDLGEHRLKDLSRAERVFQLSHPDLSSEFPPVGSLASLAHNLPVQVTSFVGREAEMRAVSESLAEHRLVTITGPGGIGKTRLAVQSAAMMLDTFAGGAWLVELASVSDPDRVVSSLAAAIGVREQPGRQLTETVLEQLEGTHLLLIIDNCEHLMRAASEMCVAVLRHCPDVRVIATSREALNVAGEAVHVVKSLTDRDSVELFNERVELGRTGAASGESAVIAVGRICERLEGIPLAIELAAARARTMSLEEITKRLDDRFRLLTGGARTTLPRQQTLRALLDWSHDLLDDDERVIFWRLSTFAGGFTLASAESVCSGAVGSAPDVVEMVTRLCDKSLVQLSASGRYLLLETMREYGSEKLRSAGEAELVARRHAEHFLELSRDVGRRVYRKESEAVLATLALELDNIRAALAWAAASDAELLVSLAAALVAFWQVRGHLEEGRTWLEAAVARPGAVTRDRAVALGGLATFEFERGGLAAAETANRTCLAIYEQLGDSEGIRRALNRAAMFANLRGEHEHASALWERAIEGARAAGDKETIAGISINLGVAANSRGDDSAAASHYRESLRLFREIGDPNGVSTALGNLAQTLINQGDPLAGRELAKESLSIVEGVGNRQAKAHSLQTLGEAELDSGDLVAALDRFLESLALARDLGIAGLAADCLDGAAWVAVGSDPERALRLAGAAEMIRESVGAVSTDERQRKARHLQPALDALGPERAATARNEGRQMSPVEADELANRRADRKLGSDG